MSSIYHSQIVVASPADALTFNTPLGQLDQAIADRAADLVNVLDGDTAFDQLRLGATTTLTISSDFITPTRSRHLVDTQGGAATDDLKGLTTTSAENGAIVCLQIVSASRVVTVKHEGAGGNIWLAAQTDLVLSDPKQMLVLIYDATTTRWVQQESDYLFRVREWLTSTLTKTKRLRLPDDSFYALGSNDEVMLRLMPRADASRVMWINAASATFVGVGNPPLTTSGTLSVGSLVQLTATTGAASGNAAGVRSTTYDYTSIIYNPTVIITQTAGTYVSNSARLYMGLTAATPANNDGPINGIMFRYSTVAGDSNIMGVVGNGTNQVTVSTGVSVNAAKRFRIRVDNTNAIVYFQVNDAAEVSLNQYLPSANLGFAAWLITTSAAAKNFSIGRFYIEDRELP